MEYKVDRLKQAHALLLEEYVQILDELSYQGFFIDLSPDRDMSKDAKGIQKLKWLYAKGNRTNPFSLKALVLLFTELHIRSKLQEIRSIYRQRKLILAHKKGGSALVKWFDQAIAETQELEATLQFWKSFWDAAASVLGAVSAGAVALLGLGSLFDVIPKLYDYIANIPTIDVFFDVFFRIVTFGVFIIAPIGVIVFSSFSAKRRLFLKGNESFDVHMSSVYRKEENLFSLLNRRKAKEYQYDLMLMLVAGGLYLAYELWFYRQIIKFGGAELNADSIIVRGVLVSVLIVASVFLISYIRKDR